MAPDQSAAHELRSPPAADPVGDEALVPADRLACSVPELAQDGPDILPRAVFPPHEGRMSRPRIPPQFCHIPNEARPEWIQMNVPGDLQEILLFLTDDRLVAVLEQVAIPPVSPVEIDDVAGEEPSHALGEAALASANEKVEMVVQEGPGIHPPGPLVTQVPHPGQEVLAVFRSPEDLGPLNPPADDMVEGARRNQPPLPRLALRSGPPCGWRTSWLLHLRSPLFLHIGRFLGDPRVELDTQSVREVQDLLRNQAPVETACRPHDALGAPQCTGSSSWLEFVQIR